MLWGYFVHVCHGPPSYAIFDFGVYILLAFPIFCFHLIFCVMSCCSFVVFIGLLLKLSPISNDLATCHIRTFLSISICLWISGLRMHIFVHEINFLLKLFYD